jgi:hypothetical protein
VIVIVRAGCAVSASVDEGMGLGEAGSFLAAGKQLTKIPDTSNETKIAIRFMRSLFSRRNHHPLPHLSSSTASG